MIKECMSGYFQFSSKEDGLYITVYPPKSGYGAASIDDVMFYVDNKNISCDSVKLLRQVRRQRQLLRCQKKVSWNVVNLLITE